MTVAIADPGSFRDPGSRIFTERDRVIRAIYRASAPEYEAVRDSGLLRELIGRGKLVPATEVNETTGANLGDPVYVLEHPRLPFVSYPYEWPFALLRRAALLQLDLLLEALDRNLTLSDASAYNIQFDGTRPLFIDHGSFRRYEEGEIWTAHRQFCLQFLNPMILWSRLGVAPNEWFRGSLEGITPEDLSRLLSWRHRFSWTILTHVTAQAALQRRANARGPGNGPTARPTLPRRSFAALLHGLRHFIDKAQPPAHATVWEYYAGKNSYAEAEAAAKREFVCEMAAAVRPKLLFDIGCNTGDYSLAALEAGAGYVVGFDFDFGALGQAVARADEGRLPFLPLWLDAANPSPSQGWAGKERKSLSERGRADAMLGLALIHHLAITRNVPLDMAVDWLMSFAPVGVIEFPPKSDPMVEQLLANRPDIFPDYTEEAFLGAVNGQARVEKLKRIASDGRLLVWYDRTQGHLR